MVDFLNPCLSFKTRFGNINLNWCVAESEVSCTAHGAAYPGARSLPWPWDRQLLSRDPGSPASLLVTGAAQAGDKKGQVGNVS